MTLPYIFSKSGETKISPMELWRYRSILKVETDDFIRDCWELLVWAINNVANKLEINK
jgi:hypothetical protein